MKEKSYCFDLCLNRNFKGSLVHVSELCLLTIIIFGFLDPGECFLGRSELEVFLNSIAESG